LASKNDPQNDPKSDPPNQPESSSPDLFSSLETRAMLQEFRELVRAGILRVTPENEVLSVKESVAAAAGGGSEKQPAGSRDEDVALLDRQLLEWLERRRRQKPEEARRTEMQKRPEPTAEVSPTGLRQKVVDRLAHKILEMWDRADTLPGASDSLQAQVAERVADEILRRWHRGLE
jgi:hypothetical protein